MTLLALLLSLAAAAHANGEICGFNAPAWWNDAYVTPLGQAQLDALAATGARWAALTPTSYMKGAHESAIYADRRTPTDDSVRAAMRRLKARGVKVAVKPHVDVDDGGPRSRILPADADAWWRDYSALTLRYARLAAEERADMFVVGTELFRLDGAPFRRRWEGLIAQVRAVYPGPLTYAANWYNAAAVGFWPALDYIGVDGYFPLPGGSNVGVLKKSWLLYEPALAAMARASGKPVLFTEVGLASQKGANHRPWDYSEYGPLDLDVQRAYMQAFLEVFQDKPWFAGFWYWAWDMDEFGGPKDKSMRVKGKPALAVLERWFRTGRAEAPPASLTLPQEAATLPSCAASSLPFSSPPLPLP